MGKRKSGVVNDAFVDSLAGMLHAAADLGLDRADIIDRATDAVDQERAITARGECSKCERILNPARCSECSHDKQAHEGGEKDGAECFDGAPEGNKCRCSGWKD